MLELYTFDAEGRRTVRSGILTDVRITADASGNTLLVSAPPESMGLIAALIAELDQIPTSTAQIKVFQVVNGDAQTLVTMLQQLFGLQVTGGAARPGQGQLFQNLGAILGGGLTGDDPLVSLRFSVDPRTNSIIASGSVGDLAIVEAILLRLDEEEVRERQRIVYRLKNVPADSVANAINTYLQSQRQLQQIVPLTVSPFEQIEREVVVVQEPVSNSLIVSATPRYFEEIRKVVEELDDRPPMVMIQVLIAEVALDEHRRVRRGNRSARFGAVRSQLARRPSADDNDHDVRQPADDGAAAEHRGGHEHAGLPVQQPAAGQQRQLAGACQFVGHWNAGAVTLCRRPDEPGAGLRRPGAIGLERGVSFLLRALSESRRLDVLARPQVMTLDNQPAFVQVGQRVPRITSSTITEVGQTNATVLGERRPDPAGLAAHHARRPGRHGDRCRTVRSRSGGGRHSDFDHRQRRRDSQPRINTTIAQTTVWRPTVRRWSWAA